MKKIDALKQIMYASSIAVIGASNKEGTIGNEIIKRLMEFNYSGKVFPVNLKDKKIEKFKAYASVLDIKESVDVAVIAVPLSAVFSVIDECNSANIKNVVIITSGFKEVGGDGVVYEKKLMEQIKKYKMNLIGPNCLGIMNTNINLNASFNPLNPKVGKVGFASQSGALASAIINLLTQKNFGISQMVSIGNQADITLTDIISFWEKDDNIQIVMLYIEGIAEPLKFKEVCKRVSKKKPIVLLKSGRSEVGSKATASHTGSLAGDDVSVSAMLASCGVIREIYLSDLINTVQLFSNCNVPQGDKLAILTNSGGPGIIATDTASDYSLNLTKLEEATVKKLKKFLPPQASVKNPCDIIASASIEDYIKSAEVLLKSDEVDILLVIYVYLIEKNDIGLIEKIQALQKKYPQKPIATVFQTPKPFFDKLTEMDIKVPVFNNYLDGIKAIKRLVERKNQLEITPKRNEKFVVNKEIVSEIIKKNNEENIKNISTKQSLEIFQAYDIPLAKFGIAYNKKEAVLIAEKIGYPIAIKISSKTITHKTDVGGVITNIQNKKDLVKNWEILKANLKKINAENSLDAIVVMEQVVNAKREFVAGMVNKENYGNMIMFGLGGIFVEALNEVVFRPSPLTNEDAFALLNNSKAKNFLKNIRGMEKANISELKNMLLKIDKLSIDFPSIKEIDINPIMVKSDGSPICVDARIILK